MSLVAEPVPTASKASRAPTREIRGAVKRYGGVTALAGVDLEIHPGEVTALLGENGAGKSTLMKVLVGAEQPDEGMVLRNGVETNFASLREAMDGGLAMVFQELTLFPQLDVLTNLFLTREPSRMGLFVNRSAMARRARPVLETIGLDVPLDSPTSALTLGEQQLVEIGRALLTDADTIVFDEPNSALNATETARLLEVVDGLREKGVAVVWVSHRLEEVFRVADVLVIMRNGKAVARRARKDTTIRQCVVEILGEAEENVGEDGELLGSGATSMRSDRPVSSRSAAAGVAESPRRRQASATAPRLEIEELRTEGVAGASLSLRPGEILGVAGLDGAGQRELMEAIYGARRIAGGTIRLDGVGLRIRSIADAIRAGIAYVPPDRRKHGLILEQTVFENMSSVRAGVKKAYGPFLNKSDMLRRSIERCAELGIRTTAVRRPVGELSGGNQQKVVLGKWLEVEPGLLLLDDPTRGVDVGAKAEIYELIGALAEGGASVLFYSSEAREYSVICDRVLVFRGGRIVGGLERTNLAEDTIVESINVLDDGHAKKEE